MTIYKHVFKQTNKNNTVSPGHFLCRNTSTVEDHNPKWKLNKANLEAFQSLCTDTITLESFKDSSDPLSDFTSSLINISSPKTSTNPTKSNPWYNDERNEEKSSK